MSSDTTTTGRAAAASPPSFEDSLARATARLVAARLPPVAWLVALGSLAFFAFDVWQGQLSASVLAGVQLCGIVAGFATLVLVRLYPQPRFMLPAAVGFIATISVLATVAGVERNTLAHTMSLVLALNCTTAAVLPWGYRCQLLVIAPTIIGLFVANAALSQSPAAQLGVVQGISIAVGLVGSLFIARVSRQSFVEMTKENFALRRLSEELHTSREELVDSQSFSHCGNWELNLGTGKLTWSDEHFRLMDLEPRSITPTPEAFFEIVHPDDRGRVLEMIANVSEGDGHDDFTYRVPLASGSNRVIRGQGHLVRGRDGAPDRICGTVQDVTYRKHIEDELRIREERLRMLGEQVPAILWTTDRELRATQVTGSALARLDASADVLLGRSVDDFFGLSGRDGDLRLLSERTLSGEPAAREFTVSGMVLDVQLRPLFDEQEEIVGTVGVAVDVTERKRIERERRLLDEGMAHRQHIESLGVLAGGFAHDFNNHLVGILGNAELAMEDAAENSPLRRLLTKVVRSAERAAGLCDQLLAYAGKREAGQERVDIAQVVEDTLPLARTSLSPAADLHVSVADPVPEVNGNAAQIAQVLLGLLVNASEAIMRDRGIIRLRVGTRSDGERAAAGASAGDYVFLEVTDTGVGIDEQTRAKIFDPLFSTKFTGRGLGLSVAASTVRQHGGRIEVESTPGLGSKFTVLLPVAECEAADRGEEATVPEASEVGGVILLVDDDDAARHVARLALERGGFEILEADGGSRALEILAAEPRCIVGVVLDMTMPGMSGAETFAEIRKVDAEVPVVLCSGYSEEEVTDHWSGPEPEAFVQKPYRLRTLLETVRVAVDAARTDSVAAAG